MMMVPYTTRLELSLEFFRELGDFGNSDFGIESKSDGFPWCRLGDGKDLFSCESCESAAISLETAECTQAIILMISTVMPR